MSLNFKNLVARGGRDLVEDVRAGVVLHLEDAVAATKARNRSRGLALEGESWVVELTEVVDGKGHNKRLLGRDGDFDTWTSSDLVDGYLTGVVILSEASAKQAQARAEALHANGDFVKPGTDSLTFEAIHRDDWLKRRVDDQTQRLAEIDEALAAADQALAAA